MRILHAIPVLAKSAGTAVYCAELCGQLVSLGIDTEIVLPASPPADRCWTPPEVSVGTFNAASTTLPDIIHVHGLWVPLLHRVADWGRRRNIPVVISPQGMLTPWSLGHKRWKKALALAVYQRHDLSTAALIHATAQSEVEDIRRLGLRQPLVVSPFGIDIPPDDFGHRRQRSHCLVCVTDPSQKGAYQSGRGVGPTKARWGDRFGSSAGGSLASGHCRSR